MAIRLSYLRLGLRAGAARLGRARIRNLLGGNSLGLCEGRSGHPDPHGAAVAVVPLEVGNRHGSDRALWSASVGSDGVVGQPGTGGGREVDRVGLDDDGGSDARYRVGALR